MYIIFLMSIAIIFSFFFSSRRRHTRSKRDWSSDVCSSDLPADVAADRAGLALALDRREDRDHDLQVVRLAEAGAEGGALMAEAAVLAVLVLAELALVLVFAELALVADAAGAADAVAAPRVVATDAG